MHWRLALRSGWPLLVLLAGCGPKDAAPTPLGGLVPSRQYLLETRSFVRRLDGDIRDVFVDRVTADRTQIVCVTGPGGGTDQCRILVFEEDGTLAASYRINGVAPWPASKETPDEPFRQRQCARQIRSFQHGPHRLLAVGTGGLWGASSLLLLRASATPGLLRSLEFWNRGSINMVEISPGKRHIAILGRCNSFREISSTGTEEYRPFVALFSVEDLLNRANGSVGQSPKPDQMEPPDAPYRLYVVIPTDARSEAFDWMDAEWTGETLVATVGCGLVYTIDPATRKVELRAAPLYANDYQKRAREDASLPPLETHLDDLRNQIVQVPGGG